ncbi:MAG TPA: polysaccharide biosynthesis tyrosine autokinase, partial [Pyrinomonadaceae bacterium]|nr:polysaccharide biosynthesis tyrosine autokinase [Pyrinomonadaceae bacterium]
MEQDQRLTPLPKTAEIKAVTGEYSAGYPSLYDDESGESRRSIQQYFNIIYKRLPIILALALIVTTAVAFYMYRLPSQYTGATEMLIEPRKPKMTSKDSININFGNDVNYYNTQLQLLKSPELMKKVVISLGLYRDADRLGSSNRGVGGALRSIFSSDKGTEVKSGSLPVISQAPDDTDAAKITLTPEEEKRAESYAAVLSGGLSVEQRERTNLVTITVTSTDPVISAQVADKVAYVFKQDDGDRETAGARQAAADLTKSIEQLRDTIAGQEAQLIADMRDSNLPLQEKGQDLSASRLGSLSETWLKAMESRRQLEGRYNAAVSANSRGEGASIPELTDSKIYQDAVRLSTERRLKLQDDIRTLEKQIQAAETERAELLVKYTPEYPEVKKMDERVASLTANKERMERDVSQIIEKDKRSVDKDAVSGALVSLRSQLDSKRREESQSLAAYEQEAAQANIQGQALTKLTTSKREIETNRNLLDTYTQRQKEQELAIAAGRPDNIKIPANAVVNPNPVGPQRNRNILVALFMSLAAGVGLAFLLDYLDDSVKTSDDIGRHLGLPTLALIPHYLGMDRKRLGLSAINGNGNVPSTALITLEERNSPMAEAYRHLRTSLLFSSAGRPPQSILVTSSQPSEGKTTTAVNTAITLAQADADVVIVDCDLRRPRLHSYFDLDNTQGLTNYLSGERNTENLIKTCKTLPRLKVITSGPIPPNPAELLSSNEMKNLLQFLRGKYKHIIIDSPPAISFTDAAIL